MAKRAGPIAVRLRAVRCAAVAGAAIVGLAACGGSSGDTDGKGSARGTKSAQDEGSSAAGPDASASPAPPSSASSAARATRTSVVFTPATPQKQAVLETTAELMRHRADLLGLKKAHVAVFGGGITATAPGKAEKKLTALGEQARLEFRPVRGESPASADRCPATTAPATEPLTACSTSPANTPANRYDLGPAAVRGADVSAARAHFDKQSASGWLVDVTFTSRGAKRFADLTTELSRQQPPTNAVAIVLDGSVLSAPAVNTTIPDGKVQISGSFTRASARELAALLSAGSLPVAMTVSSVTDIDSSAAAREAAAEG
ncbi:SecDF P1 head subdomain-containing protein [Streptomyces formicae]|nr:hypothetical protein [Streptomyces formicae]